MKQISEKKGEKPPIQPILYNGKLVSVPSSPSRINHLSVATLRAIMHCHGFPIMGTKDELAIRTLLLRQGRSAAMFAREDKQLRDFINITEQLILDERKLHVSLSSHMYQQRTFSSISNLTHKNEVQLPIHVRTIQDLPELFSPLLNDLNAITEVRTERDERTLIGTTQTKPGTSTEDSLREFLCTPGAVVKVKWSASDLGDSGWKPGWYKAVAQSYDSESDSLTITYPSEPGCIYSIDVSSSLGNGTLKLW